MRCSNSAASLSLFRQVFMAKDTETKEIVALKKIRMDNEREGVGVPVAPSFSFPSRFFLALSFL
jgi:hypothetical protein